MTWDTDLVLYLNKLTGTYVWADNFLIFFATYLPWLIITAFLIWVAHSAAAQGQRWQVFFIGTLAAIIARLGATEIIRFFYERPRPFLAHELNPLLVINEWSFPSGHAALLAALSTVVFLYDRRWGVRFFIATILVALARIVVGVHYLTDIVAGLIIGAGAGFLTYLLIRAMRPNRRRRWW